MSIHGLLYISVLHFYIVSEKLFTSLASPALWGKSGTDFFNNPGRRAVSIKITPLAILVTGGIGEGKLEIITTFCRNDQVKVEPLDMLSALVQWDLPKPGVVVVKVFTKSPHYP